MNILSLVSPINKNTPGFWDHDIIYHLSQLIIALAHLIGSYGFAILLYALVIRLAIIPLFCAQTSNTRIITDIQSLANIIKRRYSSRDRYSTRNQKKNLKELYGKYHAHPLAGMSLIIIQVPLVYALYQSIRRTSYLMHQKFLGYGLGNNADVNIVLLVVLLTWSSTFFSMLGSSRLTVINYVILVIEPFFMFTIAYRLPLAILLYWCVTSISRIVRTLVLNNPFTLRRFRWLKQRQQVYINNKRIARLNHYQIRYHKYIRHNHLDYYQLCYVKHFEHKYHHLPNGKQLKIIKRQLHQFEIGRKHLINV